MSISSESRRGKFAWPSVFASESSLSAAPLSGVHIGALDGIRGIAILLVLVHHYGRNARGFGMHHPILSATEFGWCGVDLFFVLSGFLITGILFDSRESPNYFRNFYARRALRIFPLYYAAILFVFLLKTAWPEAGIWGTHSLLWVAAYTTNFVMAVDPYAIRIFGFFWSLAVEEHFYLLWPLLVLCGTRRQLIAIAIFLIVTAFVLRATFLMAGADPRVAYFPTPMRMDTLAVGALISLLIRGPLGVAGLVRPAWIAMVTCTAGMILILAIRQTASALDPVIQTIGFTLIAFGFGGALIVGISWAPASSVLNAPILKWFGRYSYGMYVWHPIVNGILFATVLVQVFHIWSPIRGALYIVFALFIMTVVSLLSYHFLEQPFLSLKSRFAPSRREKDIASVPAETKV